MKVGDLATRDLRRRLRSGLKIVLGPFTIEIRADGPAALYQQIHTLHADYPLAGADEIADFHVTITPPRGLRHWFRPQTEFYDDRRRPFERLPAYMALPTLEWGINWCVASYANQFLMLHAGVVERHGRAILLPAHPGHGKTTLSAGLMFSGWRLLSDEFGLVRPLTPTVVPLPRLLPLKNQSIDVIRQFAPDVVIGPTFPKTKKGDVAHLRPAAESIERASETAAARLIVFPLWQRGARLELSEMPKSLAFLTLATNAFNYEVLGEIAFRSVELLIDECACYRLVYSNLPEAVAALTELMDRCAARDGASGAGDTHQSAR